MVCILMLSTVLYMLEATVSTSSASSMKVPSHSALEGTSIGTLDRAKREAGDARTLPGSEKSAHALPLVSP